MPMIAIVVMVARIAGQKMMMVVVVMSGAERFAPQQPSPDDGDERIAPRLEPVGSAGDLHGGDPQHQPAARHDQDRNGRLYHRRRERDGHAAPRALA